MDLVVARYNENVTWLNAVSPKWRVIVYNKGFSKVELTHPNHQVICLNNLGREAETYARHMKRFYGKFAPLTVFIQARPFDHAPEMKELLNVLAERTTTERYIPMTIRYDGALPPTHIVERRQNRFYRVDDTSVYTLNCLEYEDRGIPPMVERWYREYGFPLYSNILGRILEKLGLTLNQKTIKFNFAACFAVSQEALMQYGADFYDRLHKYTYEHATMPYIFERLWLHLFDPDFDSTKVLAEFTLARDVSN
jgi:hypothetical protein